MQLRAGGAVALVAIVSFFAIPVAADPWAEPGDRQLRQDIETLAAYRVIDGPVTTWPISWKQITRGLAQNDDASLPPHVMAAIRRVRAQVPGAEQYRGVGSRGSVQLTNQERIVRGFDEGAREDVDVSVALDWHSSKTYVRLGGGYRLDDPDSDFNLDDSYIARTFGNWVAYFGTVDQWWGPGHDGGLILSTNARPFPRIGVQRLDPKAFETPWLSWLGPWQVNATLGRLEGFGPEEGDRADFGHPLLLNLRVSFSPVQGLDLGFSRALQLCGNDRPCGFDIWTDALIGVGDADNTGTLDEPGNQLAGIDIRYGWAMGRLNADFYGEMVAEDEDGLLIDDVSVIFGATLAGFAPSTGWRWQVRMEGSDTQANHVFGLGENNRQGVTYNNFIYRSGYTFQGRTVGHSLDTDSRLVTLEGSILDKSQRSYWLRYRWADINVSNRSDNRVSLTNETINIFELGALAPTKYGDARLEVRLMDNDINTPNNDKFHAQIEAGWRVRF